MPLVPRDESPTTGLCSREHDVEPACWGSVCRGEPPATPHQEHTAAGGDPLTVVFVCADDPVCHLRSSPSPASTWRNLHTNDRLLASVQTCPPPHVRVQYLWRLSFPFWWQRALIWFTRYRFESWKPQTEMTVQNKKWVRVMTIEVFFLGRKCWLWVLCMNVLWETSKEHHSQFGIFQRMFQPSEGHTPCKSRLAFIKALCTLGKLTGVRERSEKDMKAKTPAKQKPRKKRFFFLY